MFFKCCSSQIRLLRSQLNTLLTAFLFFIFLQPGGRQMVTWKRVCALKNEGEVVLNRPAVQGSFSHLVNSKWCVTLSIHTGTRHLCNAAFWVGDTILFLQIPYSVFVGFFPACHWCCKGGCCGIFVSLGGRERQAMFYARLFWNPWALRVIDSLTLLINRLVNRRLFRN